MKDMKDASVRTELRIYVKPHLHELVKRLTKMDRRDVQSIMEYAEGLTRGTQATAVDVDVSALAELQAWRVQLDSINTQRDTFLIDKLERMDKLINVSLAQGGLSHADIHTTDGWAYTAKCLANWMAGKEFSALDDKANEGQPPEGKFVWDKQD